MTSRPRISPAGRSWLRQGPCRKRNSTPGVPTSSAPRRPSIPRKRTWRQRMPPSPRPNRSIITAEANVESAQATIERIQADINDSILKAPRAGRVQYRVAQPGEVLDARRQGAEHGRPQRRLHDLLPAHGLGRPGPAGGRGRLVLDAAPQFVIPAKVTFVADVAQFTPKTVETAEERQKLTFRIKAHIAPDCSSSTVATSRPGCRGGLRAA